MKAFILLLCLLPSLCLADISEREDVQSFIYKMGARHGFDESSLIRLFQQVEIKDKILESIAKPAESKPWYFYKKLFLTEARTQGGLDFWRNNAEVLAKVSSRYGVPAEMIVAIIGIETSYGKNTGNYRVIDALSTLAFDYPKRAHFFVKELEDFLVLCKEEGIDPVKPMGSYAGAMGLPQFMPSSYLHFAKDQDGDLRRDIWTNPSDAIESVANYFSKQGWKRGGEVAFQADSNKKHASHRLSLETETGFEYWQTLPNFHVIMRYNNSPLYAMAAYLLSRELLARKDA